MYAFSTSPFTVIASAAAISPLEPYYSAIIPWVLLLLLLIACVPFIIVFLVIVAAAKSQYGKAARYLRKIPDALFSRESFNEPIFSLIGGARLAARAQEYQLAEELLHRSMKMGEREIHHLLGIRYAIAAGNWDKASERLSKLRSVYSDGTLLAATMPLLAQVETMIQDHTINQGTLLSLDPQQQEFEKALAQTPRTLKAIIAGALFVVVAVGVILYLSASGVLS